MITFYDSAVVSLQIPSDTDPLTVPDGVLWLDLIDPTDAEEQLVERVIGLVLPRARTAWPRSRRRAVCVVEGDVLMIRRPCCSATTGSLQAIPVGFVLGRDPPGDDPRPRR